MDRPLSNLLFEWQILEYLRDQGYFRSHNLTYRNVFCLDAYDFDKGGLSKCGKLPS